MKLIWVVKMTSQKTALTFDEVSNDSNEIKIIISKTDGNNIPIETEEC